MKDEKQIEKIKEEMSQTLTEICEESTEYSFEETRKFFSSLIFIF